MSMNRRKFFFSSIFGFGALALSDKLLSGPDHPGYSVRPAFDEGAIYDLAIIKGNGIASTVKAAIDAIGGISQFVKKDNVVLLKPNMSFPNPPAWGSTTHPDVIRTVVKLCIEAGAKRVIAVDFPMSRAKACFDRSGMTELASSLPELTFVELKDESQFEKVSVPSGQEVKEIQIAKLIRKADVFINLPTAKSHTATGVSFGLKNLMGLFWNRAPFHQEHNLHNAIADLATVIKPHLTILDAEFVFITNGPQGPGKIEQLHTMIAGIDPVAVYAAGCELADWNSRSTAPQNVQHIAKAAERGIGTIDISKLRVFRKTLT